MDDLIAAAAKIIELTGGLLVSADAAVNALRSYQYGNSSPELAEEVADHLEAAAAEVKQAMIKMLILNGTQ